MKPVPANLDLGLLALRIISCASLFTKHGYEKIFLSAETYAKMANHHTYVAALGITPSLLCAAFADGVCAVFVIAGAATRWAALFLFINLMVAWVAVNHMAYFSGPAAGHGEMIVAYSAAMLMLMFGGGGKYSLDHLMGRPLSGQPQ